MIPEPKDSPILLRGFALFKKWTKTVTIKTARNKLFENISEHKKTKNVLSKYKEEIDQYKNILNELTIEEQ